MQHTRPIVTGYLNEIGVIAVEESSYMCMPDHFIRGTCPLFFISCSPDECCGNVVIVHPGMPLVVIAMQLG
jgi:hypothetical protein